MFAILRSAAARRAVQGCSSSARPSISAQPMHHQSRSESTLVIAEPSSDESALAPATLSAVTAASKLHSGPISLLTFASGSASVPSGVSSVIQAKAEGDHASLLAETVTNAVVAANEKHGFTHIVTPGTKFGANYLGRAGAKLGVSPISDVVEVLSESKFYEQRFQRLMRAKILFFTTKTLLCDHCTPGMHWRKWWPKETGRS